MAVYSVNLWDSLKFEILQAQEDELAQESLAVLMEIGKMLANGEQRALLDYLKPIVKESNEHLEDAPTKQSEATTRILTAVASTSATVCNQIILDVCPHVFRLLQGTENIQKKRSLTQVFQNILKIDGEIFGDWNGDLPDPDLPENALRRHSKPLLSFLKDSLIGTPIKEVSFRLALLEASLQLAKIREILSDDEIAQVVKLFTGIIVDEESYTKDDAKVAAMSALLDIAHQKSQIVVDTTFPALLARLPDSDVGHGEKYVPILEAFAKISVEERVFMTSLVRLKNRLASAVQHKASAEYVHAIMSAILYIFQHIQPRLLEGTASPGVYHDMVLPLLTQIYSQLIPEQKDSLTFTLIGKIANEVIRVQSVNFQAEFAPGIYTIPGASSKLEDCAPFSSNHDEETTRSLLISLYLLAATRPEIDPFPFNSSNLLSALVSVISDSQPSTSTKAAALLQISLIVNKFIPAASLKEVVTNFMQTNVTGKTLNLDSIRICFAILKGIQLHRTAPLLRSIFPTLLSALSDPKNGRYTAQGFSTLLQPEEVLSKENHCVIWALYKQRTFSIVVPAIIDGFRKASSETRPNYLIALSGILQWLDYSAFESEVSSITPLLLQTLDIPGEHDIKTGTIDKINEILNLNPDIVEEHASSVITRLLNLANPKGKHAAPAAVRAKALQCLSLLADKMKMEVAIPFQKQVIKRLLDCLNDGRRGVRAEAVKCRTKWIDLDDVGEDED
jgi:DNA repair/transcription protein MET18/MMS19